MNNIRKVQKLTFKVEEIHNTSNLLNQFVQELENTKEYAETHYYKIKYRTESKNLISVSTFWRDLAQHLITQKSFSGFVSFTFTQAVAHLNEMALVIGILDLPLKEENHGFRAN